MASSDYWDNLAADNARAAKRQRTSQRKLELDTGVSTAGRRLAAYLLDIVLSIVTLGIGWIVWSLFAWRRGQSPAKQLMGMHVIHDGRVATWKRMAAREILCKGVSGLICFGLARPSYGLSLIPYYFMMFVSDEREALWDRPAGTHVVEERY
jgi:uncharacterized RDD family membrane protein YckC